MCNFMYVCRAWGRIRACRLPSNGMAAKFCRVTCEEPLRSVALYLHIRFLLEINVFGHGHKQISKTIAINS